MWFLSMYPNKHGTSFEVECWSVFAINDGEGSDRRRYAVEFTGKVVEAEDEDDVVETECLNTSASLLSITPAQVDELVMLARFSNNQAHWNRNVRYWLGTINVFDTMLGASA